MVKFAAMTFMFGDWCAAGGGRHEKMVEGLARIGIEAIEPFHTGFVQEPALIGRYQKALADNGMSVSAVDVICDLVYSSPAEKRQGRDALRRGLEICAELGAPISHVAGHMPKESVALRDARAMIVEQLLNEAAFAEQHGITLAIENFGFAPTLQCKVEDCLEILKLGGGKVRFLFDAGNFEFVGERADANLELLYEQTCYVHFKDVRPASARQAGDIDFGGRLVGCPLGEGVVRGAQVAAILKARNYAGWVALECCSVLGDPMSTVARDLAVLKRWLGQPASKRAVAHP